MKCLTTVKITVIIYLCNRRNYGFGGVFMKTKDFIFYELLYTVDKGHSHYTYAHKYFNDPYKAIRWAERHCEPGSYKLNVIRTFKDNRLDFFPMEFLDSDKDIKRDLHFALFSSEELINIISSFKLGDGVHAMFFVRRDYRRFFDVFYGNKKPLSSKQIPFGRLKKQDEDKKRD